MKTDKIRKFLLPNMLAVMLPAFLLAMYERDGLPFEKVVGNIIRAKFLRPGVRPYQTQNIYAPLPKATTALSAPSTSPLACPPMA